MGADNDAAAAVAVIVPLLAVGVDVEPDEEDSEVEEEGRRVRVDEDGSWERRPFDSSRIDPRSEPYAGGGASVPSMGARPHFLTLASMKTNPA